MQLNRILLSGAACAALTATTAPVLAQDVSTAPSAAEYDDRDIIVTARFRNETLQDVPQAISAFDARSLSAVAARDITDLAPSTPNVSIQPVATFSNSASIYMRGLGGQDIESTVESPVGISIDGIFMTRPVATMLDTFDLERIEVLRGPQGTSFGKNSLAGGIAAHSKNPSGEFGIRAEASIGNYGRMDVRGAIDVPIISDALSARLMVNKEHYNGFFTNRVDGKRIGGQNRLSMRATISATPTEGIEINLKGFLVRDRSSAPGGDSVPERDKALYLYFQFLEPEDGAFTIGRDFSAAHDTDQLGLISNISLGRADNWNIKLITGYVETDDFNDSDFDHSEKFLFPTFRLQSHRQFSQEVRWQTDFAGRDDALARLDLVLGGYYLNQSFEMTQAFPTLPALLGTAAGSQDFVAQKNKAHALFAQAIYGITDRLNITLGVRQSWEQKNYLRDYTGYLGHPAYFTDRSVVLPLDVMEELAYENLADGKALSLGYKRNRMTFKAGMDYQLTDDVMVYGAFSQGYKGGGFGARAASVITAGPTNDNTSELFEIGMKGDFFDRLLRLNLTAFITDYKQLEFSVFIPNDQVASGQETAASNVGAARTKGIEIEASLRPTQNLTLSANIGYLDAKFTDFCADVNGPSTHATPPTSSCGSVRLLANSTDKYLVDEDYSYLKMTRAPKWQTQLVAEYAVPMGDAGKLNLRLAGAYRSSYYSSAMNEAAGKTGDFILVDGSIAWESDDSRLRAQL